MAKFFKYGGALALVGILITVFMLAGQHKAQSKDAENKEVAAWLVRCSGGAEGAEQNKEQAEKSENQNCEIFQRLSVKETGQRLLEFAIGEDPARKGVSRGVVVLPLGILLQPGVVMQIDDIASYKFDIHHCTEKGCFAYVDLTDDIVKQMKKGTQAAMTMQTTDGKTVRIGLSLKGFTQAYKKI